MTRDITDTLHDSLTLIDRSSLVYWSIIGTSTRFLTDVRLIVPPLRLQRQLPNLICDCRLRWSPRHRQTNDRSARFDPSLVLTVMRLTSRLVEKSRVLKSIHNF